MYITAISIAVGLGFMALLWVLISPEKQTITVSAKAKRFVRENVWTGRATVEMEVAAFFLTDTEGHEFRATKATYSEAVVGQPLVITARGRFWTTSFALAHEPGDSKE